MLNTVDDTSSILNQQTKAQRTPLMLACQLGHLEALKLLVEVAQADYMTQTESGTPLILAVESGNLFLVNYLRSLPGCPSFEGSDLAGVTPLYVACYNHRLEMINHILESPEFDITTQFGPNQSTVFHGVVDRDFRKIAS